MTTNLKINDFGKEILEECNTWPFQEAKKIINRLKYLTEDKLVVFETGYGPSGLPHIGTFCEVFRTNLVRKAFTLLTGRPSKLICFSDDMDGLRKVPSNIPNQESMSNYIGHPLTKVPDPFQTHSSFGDHNNSRLKSFLDSFNFEYEFYSATDCYKSGLFDKTLIKVLDNYEKIKQIILPTLGEERRKTYSPFLPICQKTGKVLEVSINEINKMNVVRHAKSDWAANWKTGLESFYETYHLSFIHPQTQGMMEDYYVPIDTWANGMNRMIVPFVEPSKRQEGKNLVNEATNIMLADVGIEPSAFDGNAVDAKKAIQKKKREFSNKFDLGYERYTDAQLTDSFVYGIFPNIQLGCHPEGVFVHKFMPHPDNPELFTYETFINYRVVDNPDYHVPAWFGLPENTDTSGKIRPEITHYPLGVKPDLGEVLDQDAELIPFVQDGIRSRGFKGPLWSEQELRLRHFHFQIDQYMNSD